MLNTLSDTYILDITLGDAVGAVRQTDAAYDESTTAVGFSDGLYL